MFFEDSAELKGHPALIQKSDGAANYTTTDLATLAYRLETWNPDEIVYVTDGRQRGACHRRRWNVMQRRRRQQTIDGRHVEASRIVIAFV